MTSGKYLNKGVIVLDAAEIGHVIRETTDKIIVFEKNEARYDIPIHEIQQVGASVLIGINLSDIDDRYKVERKEPLPPGRNEPWHYEAAAHIDPAAYEGKYATSLFNKRVRAKNDHLGHVMKGTSNKIIVFCYSSIRHDIPKYHIIAVGRNVILILTFLRYTSTKLTETRRCLLL